MIAVIIVEIFESLIDGQARLNPSSIAATLERPFFISSLVLSKIKILASTAMPIERIYPAMPARVIVINNLKIAAVNAI